MTRSKRTPESVEAYRKFWKDGTDVPYGFCWCGCGEKTNKAESTKTDKHLLRGEPVRRRKGHQNGVHRGPEFLVDPETECWIWQYGIYSNNGRGYKDTPQGRVYAHRYVYEQFHGSIKAGNHIHHRCDNLPCVNPSHMAEVTPTEHAKIHARYGTFSPLSKYTDEEIEEIREERKLGTTMRQIAESHSMDLSYVYDILSGKSRTRASAHFHPDF